MINTLMQPMAEVGQKYLVHQLAAELVVLLQHLVPQIAVHALHNVASLDLEQTASWQHTCHCLMVQLRRRSDGSGKHVWQTASSSHHANWHKVHSEFKELPSN